MTRVHAFADDALGDLDAVGLVAAIQAGAVSVPEVVEAAIARAERVKPELNAVAYVAFDRARAEARDPRGGFFAGVPTFVKDNVDVAGMPTQQGSDAFVARPEKADGDFARMFLATGLIPLGKTQLSEFGFSAVGRAPAARAGPHARGTPSTTAGRLLVRLGGAGGRRRRTDRARQRRRRLDPDPGRGQRPGRPQAHPRPAGPGQDDARRCRCGSSPTAW